MGEREEHKRDYRGILRQIDEWCGKKHRVWFFLTGFGIAALLFWYVFVPVTLDQTRKSYDRIYLDQDVKISEMQKEVSRVRLDNTTLTDSINQLLSIGRHWGTHEICVPLGSYTPSNIARPIFGRMIRAYADVYEPGYAYIRLLIDTCATGVRHIDSHCQYYKDYVPVALEQFAPFSVRSATFHVYCKEITDSTVVIELYRKE